jgi:hypothetical protein
VSPEIVIRAPSVDALFDQWDPWTDTFARTFVVIAWVALWDPGQSVVDAASNRLARKHYAALAQLDTQVRSDVRPAT